MTPYNRRLNPYIQRMAEDMQVRNLAEEEPVTRLESASREAFPAPPLRRLSSTRDLCRLLP